MRLDLGTEHVRGGAPGFRTRGEDVDLLRAQWRADIAAQSAGEQMHHAEIAAQTQPRAELRRLTSLAHSSCSGDAALQPHTPPRGLMTTRLSSFARCGGWKS